MSVVVLNPAKHLVKETQAAAFFRRKLRDDDLLTYWNAETGQWILAYWMSRNKRVVDEIEDLGPEFEAITDDFVTMLMQCYGNVDLRKTKGRYMQKHRARIKEQNDEICMDQERWDWLKKRTKDKSPIPYAYHTPIGGGASPDS